MADEASSSEALNRAIEQKNKILMQDRATKYGTNIIDDQMDFYESDASWMSPAERRAMHEALKAREEAREAAKRQINISLDLENQSVIACTREDLVNNVIEQHMNQARSNANSIPGSNAQNAPNTLNQTDGFFRNPFLCVEPPKWNPSSMISLPSQPSSTSSTCAKSHRPRIQHDETLEDILTGSIQSSFATD